MNDQPSYYFVSESTLPPSYFNSSDNTTYSQYIPLSQVNYCQYGEGPIVGSNSVYDDPIIQNKSNSCCQCCKRLCCISCCLFSLCRFLSICCL